MTLPCCYLAVKLVERADDHLLDAHNGVVARQSKGDERMHDLSRGFVLLFKTWYALVTQVGTLQLNVVPHHYPQHAILTTTFTVLRSFDGHDAELCIGHATEFLVRAVQA